MVSYASDGGTVGPHDDLYDVFLLRGPGRRRWQISTQADRTLDPDAAIKVLKSFVPEEEWLLEPGDMLYLPRWWRTAASPRAVLHLFDWLLAPSHRELVQGFLGSSAKRSLGKSIPTRMGIRICACKRTRPGRRWDGRKVAAILGHIRWDGERVGEFLGRYLTGNKSQRRLHRSGATLSESAFATRLSRPGDWSCAAE